VCGCFVFREVLGLVDEMVWLGLLAIHFVEKRTSGALRLTIRYFST
jgi:hypothetical protein